jgi:hypothetical protein
MPTCRGCHAEIGWVTTKAGHPMPIEPSSHRTYHVFVHEAGKPQIALVTDDGAVVRGRLGNAGELGVTAVVGAESHFARCSASKEFRRA